MIVLTLLDAREQRIALLGQLHARGVACDQRESFVLVDPDEFEAGFAVLEEMDLVPSSPWTGESCPSCGKHQVIVWGVNWKRASWAFLLLTVATLGLPLLWRRRVHLCLLCGANWEAGR